MIATDTISMSKKFLEQINEIFGPSKLRHRLKYGVARDVIGMEYLRIEREREVKAQKDIISELKELDVDSMSPAQLDNFLNRYRMHFGSTSPYSLGEDPTKVMSNKLEQMAMVNYSKNMSGSVPKLGSEFMFGEDVTVLDADDPDLMEKIAQASDNGSDTRPKPVEPEPVNEED